jgi:hypothetical protein
MADVVKDIYRVDDGSSIVANASIETACIQLQQLKGKIKEFEEAEDSLKEFIQSMDEGKGHRYSLRRFHLSHMEDCQT